MLEGHFKKYNGDGTFAPGNVFNYTRTIEIPEIIPGIYLNGAIITTRYVYRGKDAVSVFDRGK